MICGLILRAAVISLICFAAISASASETEELRQICQKHPERIAALFQNLDLNRPDLRLVKQATEKQDMVSACRELLRHFQHSPAGERFRKKDAEKNVISDAENIQKDIFTFLNRESRVPRLENSRLNWSWQGPDNDPEWAWHLNRHTHLHILLDAWEQTGNPAYVQTIDAHIQDWILSHPARDQESFSPQWRGIEVFHRLCYWPRVFFRLSRELSPETLILMLSSIMDHSRYLMRFQSQSGNRIAMEMNGLAIAAECWPEFRESQAWGKFAAERMLSEIRQQVYPDGVHKELSAHYHLTALDSFMNLFHIRTRSGQRIPAEYRNRLERMWQYLAYVMRPDGFGPRSNDCVKENFREPVLNAARIFSRPDWAWPASQGKQGKRPDGELSRMFPWAGQLLMRSADGKSHWAFFDIGPWGTGHQHQDRLHLSLFAFGRELLSDRGTYTYKQDKWREYFTGSAAHNVMLIDGKRQNKGEEESRFPVNSKTWQISPTQDYAGGSVSQGFENTEGQAVHKRTVFYMKNRCWLVADRMETDRPRQIQALWHFHPDCTVEKQGKTVASTDKGKGNLRIVPLSDFLWETDVIKGQTEPEIQGWHSEDYNLREPAPTAVFSAHIQKSVSFAWILMPAKGQVPQIHAEMISADENAVHIRIDGENAEEVTIPFF